MVLRYWGMVGVRPEDFSHLVSEARGGMTAEDLGAEIAGLGWDVFPFRGRYDEIRRHLGLGRPVISLIEVGPSRFHYVVLVGRAGDRIVVHDPAASPFRLIDRAQLEAAWRATDGLSLLVVPPAGRGNVREPPDEPVRPAAVRRRGGGPDSALTAVCRGPFDRALAAASAGRLSEAEGLLRTRGCVEEPPYQRELAGLLLRLGRAEEATAPARRALTALPEDGHAARTLATALYVADRPEEALGAWNRVAEPTVDLVRIAGLERVAHRPVARLLGIRGGDLLTASSLRLARRRVASLPAAAASRVAYAPTGSGRADVVAAIAEREGLPTSPLPLAALAIRAGIYREIALTAASPLGRGETWTGAWRWWENRPAVEFGFAGPAEIGPAAIWRLDASWQRETYGSFVAGAEENTSARLETSAWVLPVLRADLRLGFDRWVTSGDYGRVGLSAETRWFGDRLRLTADADAWTPVAGGSGHRRGGLEAVVVTAPRPEKLAGTGRVYVRSVGGGAPPTLWPGAGAGIARTDLLRAHPLLEDGVLAGPAFDRSLAGAGAEVVRWFSPTPALRIGAAAFVDVARTWGVRPDTTLVDAGIGLRLSTAAGGPTVRIDLATGLSDDAWAVTAGWSSAD